MQDIYTDPSAESIFYGLLFLENVTRLTAVICIKLSKIDWIQIHSIHKIR